MNKRQDNHASRQTDHRTRVGLERREKTRAKLLAAALPVFARHGADAAIIDSIIKQAGVSRGTFYNYFRTNEELFVAVAQEVSDELIRVVDPIVLKQKDPAARVACGVSSVVELARAYPLLAQFVVRGGPMAIAAGGLATDVVLRDVDAGMAAGRFSVTDKRLAFDLVIGPVISAFHTVLTAPVAADYPQVLAESILRALGVERSAAHRFAQREFGRIELATDSIFALSGPHATAN